MRNKIIQGDCLTILSKFEEETFDLIYLDPPFFTQKDQQLSTRCGSKKFIFNDIWDSSNEYGQYIGERIYEFFRVLKKSGSIFVHCDKNSSYILRMILDDIFGKDNFISEIIWYYKRWSNSKKGLLSSHQTIFFYSKSDNYIFNRIYQEYSESTNIDQILQLRERNINGKSIYKRDENGEAITRANKKGVPLNDVWEIPYLNPKAKERVGYPTQKPILLLERIIQIASNEDDLILDPFCGSGTTLVAAKLLKRNYIGIDISKDAVDLSESRLTNPVKTISHLLKNGREFYIRTDLDILSKCGDLDIFPVQRNKGIDAILKYGVGEKPVPIRIQRDNETFFDAINALMKASKKKGAEIMILIKTNDNISLFNDIEIPDDVIVLNSMIYSLEKKLITANKSFNRTETASRFCSRT